MPQRRKCTFCNRLTLRVDDASKSYSECSNCGFVGWAPLDPVNPGSGKGYRCVNCGKHTLHEMTNVPDSDVAMYRCSTCSYAGVRHVPA